MSAPRPEAVWGASHLISERRENLVEARLAVFDPARTHRYLLEHRWGAAAPMVFVMLNPSTADATREDPTMRRCLRFARREGCGGLIVVNLFAPRTTDPSILATHPDPVGPDNDQILCAAVGRGTPVVAAWGAHGALHARDQAVLRLLYPARLSCLGRTAHGQPRHPLYLPANAPLTDYRPDGEP
ncbi:MAG TPA: DUF1643 domain-containing protein [Actinocrinis sp.]|uniref:DUF1643 domain-containing protein n=1 Tax=Actinocrinis sp. TaxID=1920516 RepID=UPI002DDD424F|nr:DUF1643 domain-containing protein [Actinocrinis sp.]HEV2343460.1 DUF1643 domain-containing protein [Actinocrinis sp.]